MAGLVPAIHVFNVGRKTWMPGTSAGHDGVRRRWRLARTFNGKWQRNSARPVDPQTDRGGAYPAVRALCRRSGAAGLARSAARARGLSRARELPARPAGDRRAADRCVATAHHRSHRRRGAGNRLRLYRAADGEPGAARRYFRDRQSEKLDRPARCVHPRDRRSLARLRSGEAGYEGPLYAEISPRTFPVLVRQGSRLSQIRFRRGDSVLDAAQLRVLHERERLVDSDDADLTDGVAVGVDLSGEFAGGVDRLSRKASYRPDRCGSAWRL